MNPGVSIKDKVTGSVGYIRYIDLNLGMSHPRFQAMYPINSTGRTNGLGSRLGAIIKRIRLLMGYNQDIGLGPDISIKGTRIRV